MRYDFDTVPFQDAAAARDVASIKWGTIEREFGTAEAIPLWVADMDFRPPPPVLEALRRRIEAGALGYSYVPEGFYGAVTRWASGRHGWSIEPGWIAWSPGVVFSLSVAVTAFTEPGDSVIVQPPVYPYFFSSVQRNGREIVYNPLLRQGNRYHMDLDDLRAKIDEKTKMFILCSPHNPVGRVWRPDELTDLGELCVEHGITILSDDIHCDLVFPPHRYVPIAALSEALAQVTITLTAPTKTFNIAGIHTSTAVIPNAELRSMFERRMRQTGVHLPGALGVVATEAAYGRSADWLDQALGYIEANMTLLEGFLADRLPEIGMTRPQGTYLVWLDFTRLGMGEKDASDFLTRKSGVALTPGSFFGPGGTGYHRMNVACPRSTLQQALDQLSSAYRELAHG